MKNEVTTNNDYTESLFEFIKHVNEYGQEFWYARELQKALAVQCPRIFQHRRKA